jgi:hypothetical protein
MSRRKKRPRADRYPHRGPPQQLEDDVVRDTAAVFTCSHKTAADFAAQCHSRREDLACDITFNRLALEMWTGRPGRAAELAAALNALLAARQRHDDELASLGRRLSALAEENLHEHLDPPEAYCDLVRQRVFESPPPTSR